MDKSKALYDKLNEGKLYTKSYDEFVNQFGTPEGQKKLYNALSSQKLYTKSQDDFSNQFWSNAPVAEEVKKKDVTELSGTTDSLGGGFNFEKKASQLSQLGITKPTSLSKEDLAKSVVNEDYNRQIDEINKKNADKKVLDALIEFGVNPILHKAGVNKTILGAGAEFGKMIMGTLEGGATLLANKVFPLAYNKELTDWAKSAHESAMWFGDVDQSLERQQKREMGFDEKDLDKSMVELYKEGKVGNALTLGGIGFVHALPQIFAASALTPAAGSVGVGGKVITPFMEKLGTFGVSAGMSLGSELANESEETKGLTGVGVGKAFFKASLDGLTEALGMKDIYAARKIADAFEKPALESIKSLIKSEGKDIAKEEIVRNFLGFTKKALGKSAYQEALGGGVQETLEEVVSTAGSFIIDRVADGKWESANYAKLTNDLIESGIGGFISGFTMSGVSAAASIKRLSAEQQVKINKLNEVYNNASLSEDIRNVAKKQIDDIVKYSKDESSPIYDNITNLPRVKRAEALDLTFKINSLEEQKSEIKDVEMQNGIDEQIQSITQQRQQLFDIHNQEQADTKKNYPLLMQGQKFEVNPNGSYVFTFPTKEDVPEPLKGVPFEKKIGVHFNQVQHTRFNYSGQALIDAGLATQQVEKVETPQQATNAIMEAVQKSEQQQQKQQQSSEQVKRQQDLEDALAKPDNGKGTVSIGETLLDRKEAQSELDKIKEQNGQTTNVASKEGAVTPSQSTAIDDAVSQITEFKTEGKPTEKTRLAPTKGGKPPKPKGRVYERALEVDDNSPEAAVIKFFAAGGKVMRSNPKNNTGAKLKTLKNFFSKSKQGNIIPIMSEVNNRRSISAEQEQGGLSMDAIAHKLWEQAGAPENISAQDFLAAVEEAIKSFQTKSQMAAHLLAKNQVSQNGLSLEQGFQDAQMQWEADQMGMTLEEFEQFLEDNPDYNNDRNDALDETEHILNNIEDYPELLASLELTEEEKADLNALFAEEASTGTQQTEETKKPIPVEGDPVGPSSSADPSTPNIPPVPPTPPSDNGQEMSPEETPEEAGSNSTTKDVLRLFRKAVKQRISEQQNKWKTIVLNLPEMFYDSQFTARRAIEKLGKFNLASARLRILKGTTGLINHRLSIIDADIWDDMDINERADMDAAVYLKNTIQKDDNQDDKRNSEEQRLIEKFSKTKDRQPNAQELKIIKAAAKIKFPILSHGNIEFEGKPTPLTRELAQRNLNEMEKSMGKEKWNKLMIKLEKYKKVGNDQALELYQNGSISKEVYDEYKDDFYAMRQTVERFFDSFSDTEKKFYGGSPKAWNALSKYGTQNDMFLDSRIIMHLSFASTQRALAKNKFKQSLYDETIGSNNTPSWAKPANIKVKKLGEEKGKILEDKKGEQVLDPDKGFRNISFLQDGKLKHFQVEEKIYEQLEGENQIYNTSAIADGALLNINDYRNRLLTGMATRYNPTFFFANIVKDLTHQTVFTDIWSKSGNVFSSALRALYHTFKMTDVLNLRKTEREDNLSEFILAGGQMNMISKSSESKKQFMLEAESQMRDELQGKKFNGTKPIVPWYKSALSYLNERTELAMRLAAYNQVKKNVTAHVLEENKKKGIDKISKLQERNIQEIAAAQARAYTDFAQKGTYLPYKTNIPYLNAAFQTFGTGIEYAIDNKAKIVSKLAQIGAVNFIWTLTMMTLMGDDYWDIPEYEKDNMLLPVYKNKEGVWKTLKFGIDNTLLPWHSATRYAAEELHNHITGKERIEKTKFEKYKDIADAVNKGLPIPLPITPNGITGIISKELWLNAIMKAYTGYDVFRGRDFITQKEREGDFAAEGKLNEEVPFIYKVTFGSLGISPARAQAVGETFYTSPSTNGGIGAAYLISSSLANYFHEAKTQKEAGVYTLTGTDSVQWEKMANSLSKRFISKTEVGYFEKQQQRVIRKKAEEIGKQAKSQDDEVKTKIIELTEANKGKPDAWDKTKAEMVEFVKENSPLVDKKRVISLMRTVNKTNRTKERMADDIEESAYSVRYSPSVNSKAELLYYIAEGDVKKADAILHGSVQAGLSHINRNRVRREYLKLLKERKND
jgi:hypothetical protein